MNSNKFPVYLLCLLGWLFSGYFWLRSISIGNSEERIADLCKILFSASCDPVLQDPYSWQGGISMSSLGLLYFGIVGMILALQRSTSILYALLVVAFGVGVSIWQIEYLLSLDMRCWPCVSIHVINLILFGLLVWYHFTNAKFRLHSMEIHSRKGIPHGLFVLGIILVGFFVERHIVNNNIGSAPLVRLKSAYSSFLQENPIDFNSALGRVGDGHTPHLQLVVFSSYQCSGCRDFNTTLQTLREKYGNDLEVIELHYPLSTQCNDRLDLDLQPQSCNAALAAIAAERQERFLPFHNALFASNLQADDSTLTWIADAVGLDLDRFQRERTDSISQFQLQRDIQIGNALEIQATPSVFLDGRLVTNRSSGTLQYFMTRELERVNQ